MADKCYWHNKYIRFLRELDNNCIGIIITSDKCYENQEWEWGYREIDKLGGEDPYSASKGSAELAFKSYFKSYFSEQTLNRLGSVLREQVMLLVEVIGLKTELYLIV